MKQILIDETRNKVEFKSGLMKSDAFSHFDNIKKELIAQLDKSADNSECKNINLIDHYDKIRDGIIFLKKEPKDDRIEISALYKFGAKKLPYECIESEDYAFDILYPDSIFHLSYAKLHDSRQFIQNPNNTILRVAFNVRYDYEGNLVNNPHSLHNTFSSTHSIENILYSNFHHNHQSPSSLDALRNLRFNGLCHGYSLQNCDLSKPGQVINSFITGGTNGDLDTNFKTSNIKFQRLIDKYRLRDKVVTLKDKNSSKEFMISINDIYQEGVYSTLNNTFKQGDGDMYFSNCDKIALSLAILSCFNDLRLIQEFIRDVCRTTS